MDTLYELTGELLDLYNMAGDEEVDDQILQDTIEGVQGAFELKIESYAKVIKNLEADAKVYKAKEDAFKDEADRYKAKREAIENHVKRMKKHMTTAMVETGNTKFKTDCFSFYVQNNPPSVVVDDEKAIPDKYFVVKRDVSKTQILEALKNGEVVAGAHMEQGQGVRFR